MPESEKMPSKTIKGSNLYVFIDASNLWQAQKAKAKVFDYEKLKGYLKRYHKATAIKIYFYSAYPAEGTRDYDLSGKHRFFTYLSKGLGFEVRKKPLKQISVVTDIGVAIEEKGNMDVEMAIDAVHTIDKYDMAVLFTGDSDFLSLVKYIRARGKQVYTYSSANNISSELRTGADGYTDVLKIRADIWRKPLKHRNEK